MVDCLINTFNKKLIINNDYDYDIKYIIIIQKNIRRFLIRKKILITPSNYQTKNWRNNMKWYNNGKSNECELYQINIIEQILKISFIKTNDRINMEDNKIYNKRIILNNKDGYEYTENFDGKNIINNKIYYFNLKFVCNNGGHQTRSLREVYHFIKHQLEYIYINNISNTYFINILDGDESYKNIDKFLFIINKDKYKEIIKYIFIGNLYEFQNNKYKYFN